ncbi:MAG: hypothetical protein Q9170_003742 [Blastenia crenularia]
MKGKVRLEVLYGCGVMGGKKERRGGMGEELFINWRHRSGISVKKLRGGQRVAGLLATNHMQPLCSLRLTLPSHLQAARDFSYITDGLHKIAASSNRLESEKLFVMSSSVVKMQWTHIAAMTREQDGLPFRKFPGWSCLCSLIRGCGPKQGNLGVHVSRRRPAFARNRRKLTVSARDRLASAG